MALHDSKTGIGCWPPTIITTFTIQLDQFTLPGQDLLLTEPGFGGLQRLVFFVEDQHEAVDDFVVHPGQVPLALLAVGNEH